MNALDTNVWIYLHDARDPHKQEKAREIVAKADPLVLPWQVGCEFIAAATKLERFGFTVERAWTELSNMRTAAHVIALPHQDDWLAAKQLQGEFTLSFWDALLIAVCDRYGVKTLHSEDFGSPRQIRGMQIVNPFK